jgi:hypothetical protein
MVARAAGNQSTVVPLKAREVYGFLVWDGFGDGYAVTKGLFQFYFPV